MNIKIRPGTVALIVLIVIVAVVLLSLLAGYRFDTVRSGSMSPEIGVGDLVVSGTVDPEEIEVGDVIIYRSQQGALVCHRVIAVDPAAEQVITKGDANEGPDPAVPYSSIVTKTIGHVPYLGYVVSYLSSMYGLATIVVIVTVVYLLGGMNRKDSAKQEEE